jgi:hypothetical protein
MAKSRRMFLNIREAAGPLKPLESPDPWMDRVMKIATSKVRYVDKVLKPMGERDRKDGEEVETKFQGSATSKIFGIVKCWEGLEDAHEGYMFISKCKAWLLKTHRKAFRGST